MKRIYWILIFVLISQLIHAQDSTKTNLDAIYNRPFVASGKMGMSTTSIGGYLEANTNYFITDGVTEGFNMEMRRFNIFMYSAISPKIKMLSELEFEHGTEEIALETALLDFEVNSQFVLRGGIVLPPLGYFNQNHDGPKWEFIERPLVSTTILPATLSEVGFGFYGKTPVKRNVFTYEAYIVNGLADGIIANENSRTSLQWGKHPEIFAEDNNGTPSVTGRVGYKKRGLGEFGLGFYNGIYNTFRIEGTVVDAKRNLSIVTADYNFAIKKLRIIGEAALVNVDVPDDYGQVFGKQQYGAHIDFIYPAMKRNILGWQDVVLNTNLRVEQVDYNVGNFEETGDNIYDELTAIVPGLSLRFTYNTVLKLNYRYQWHRDLLGNPATKTAGLQFGFASYF